MSDNVGPLLLSLFTLLGIAALLYCMFAGILAPLLRAGLGVIGG